MENTILKEKSFPVHYSEVIHPYCPECSIRMSPIGSSMVDVRKTVYWYRCSECQKVSKSDIRYPYLKVWTTNGMVLENYICELKEGISES